LYLAPRKLKRYAIQLVLINTATLDKKSNAGNREVAKNAELFNLRF
jgi:hypothetical protein